MGGQIWAESRCGRGSQFHFVALFVDSLSSGQFIERSVARNMKTSPARNRILIAEDDSVSRRVLEAFLVKWGYEVVSASDGTQAWEILSQEDSPRIAVLDWMMPGLEGVQICSRLRRITDRPYTYVLLLTARAQKQDMLDALKAGADDYLSKPFDSEELKARLNVGLRILKLQDDLIAAKDALLYQATHDFLTGVANRAEVLSAMQREIARCRRQNGSFGAAIADLDHFKNINDTYGHAAGDAVLRAAAQRMRESVRTYDTVGRYGGEEFLIIAPLCDEAGVLAMAERIRSLIASAPVEVENLSIPIAVSLGVAVSTPDHPLDADSLLHAADEALYRAKNKGRNRVEYAGDPAGSLNLAPVV
jgi:two-component system, cell cycle response regulator